MYEQAKSIAITLLSAQPAISPAAIGQAISQALMLFPALDRDQLTTDLTAHYSVISHDYRILEDKDVYQPWVRAARAARPARFWKRYRDYLLFDKKMAPDTVDQLDNLTDDILDRLRDPQTGGSWDRRGMVVGNVQSGKTSNYTGLICKAADAGYRLIIVLTGIHSNLRQQTQLRIDEGFIGRHSHLGHPIGAGLRDPKPQVHSITTSRLAGDFSRAAASAQNLAIYGQDPVIAVVKKNPGVLRNIIEWLNGQGQELADGKHLLTNLPMLLIDDEADNASINVSPSDVSTINASIRVLLSLFEQRAYVGYTATPFANIFIPVVPNADALDANIAGNTYSLGQDLFPRHFIINLPAPSNYVGPERIFGLGEPTDEDDAEQHILPVRIQIDDYRDAIPDKHKKGSGEQHPTHLPESLESAVRHFILSCAARIARGQQNDHSSMLVHVTRFTNWQTKLGKLLNKLMGEYRDKLESNVGTLEAELRQLWEEKYQPVTREIQEMTTRYRDPAVVEQSWEQIRPHLWPAAARIEVRVVHSAPDHSDPALFRPLNYEEYERKDMKVKGLFVIAVGGDRLSRGLTLEGLCISYYLRASKMYDTLMQMGRWFGYRPGYVDLCRLFTSEELIRWYRHVTLATEEMRHQFDVMAYQKSTPIEYGLKVRTLPGVLQITATNKLREATPMELSYSGTLIETYAFARDLDRTRRNYQATNDLLRQLGSPTPLNGQPHAWQGVSASKVTTFLRSFFPSRDVVGQALLIEYIGRQRESSHLTDWTVVLIDAKKAKGPDSRQFSFTIDGEPVELTATSRYDSSPRGVEYTVAKSHIISARHEYLDFVDKEDVDRALAKTREIQQSNYQERLDRLKPGAPPPPKPGEPTIPSPAAIKACRAPQRALLLIYPLDPINIAEKEPTLIEGFEEVTPIMGYAISFPVIKGDRKVSYLANAQFRKEFDYPTELDPADGEADNAE